MKALVTGATGFIGGNLVNRLLSQGWVVHALVRRKSKYSALKRKGVVVFFGDLNNFDSIKRATRGVDVVFNCAAALPYHKLPGKEYEKANVLGVTNVLETAKRSRVKRVVHISSVAIYKPTDVYSKTKLSGERIVWDHVKKGLAAAVIRPTIAYGPGDIRPGFLDLFRLIKKGMFIPVGTGENLFHTIYIDNLIDALYQAATKKAAQGEGFIIGDDPCPKMKQIIKAIATVQGKKLPRFYIPLPIAYLAAVFFEVLQRFGIPAPLTIRRVKFITEPKKFNITKAKRLLDYKPRVGLKEGVEKTYNWYKSRGYL